MMPAISQMPIYEYRLEPSQDKITRIFFSSLHKHAEICFIVLENVFNLKNKK